MRRWMIGAGLLVMACSPKTDTAATAPNLDAERAAILKADSAWLAAATSRNADSALSFWTDDARVISPYTPPVVGRDAIRKMITDGFAMPQFSVTWTTTDVVVAPSGDMAYSLGMNRFTMPNATGGVDTLNGQNVVVWRKESDGRWKSVVDMSSPQAPPTGSAPPAP